MPEETTIWYTRCPVPSATGMAIQRGLIDDEFAPDGIVVRSLASSPDAAVRSAHYMQAATDLFRQGGNTPPLIAASKGVDHRFLGLSWTYTSQPVLVLPESDVRTAADLRGKRLSVPRRPNDKVDFWYGTTLRTYKEVLASAGLTLDDVELVEVDVQRTALEDAKPNPGQRGALWGAWANAGHQRDEALALARGEVDAIASEAAIGASVTATLRLRAIANAGGFERPYNNLVPVVMSVSGPLLDRRPDLVERFLVRVLETAEWAAEHESEAKRMIAGESGIAEEFVDAAWGADVHTQLDLRLDEWGLAALRSQAEHLLAIGFLDRPVDVDALIDPAPLAAARIRLDERRAVSA
ncbi:ABC transporter substrate-binding protein [Conexibacter sp. CPCC 206217]|uniref:ABC transporter substrate-binding protein n=1 Tax=Conexibacter sp. CPCC 206217 TaxID=3064574 RepID=UPI00271E5586|nr:hypothetical protein [Conexibacter sp. CPCC 206217]MDO8212042.1 hypothetical protein [Conexibacter sp. CPCC 206217]